MIVLERVFVQMSDRRFLKCSVGKTDKGASCLNQFHPERIGQVYNYRLGDKTKYWCHSILIVSTQWNLV